MKEWKIEELTPEDIEQLEKEAQPSCQAGLEGSTGGMGGPEGHDDTKPFTPEKEEDR